MAEISQIEWTDATWNIARGCTKVDEDCKFCYMYRDSFDSTRYNPLQVVRTKTVFDMPLRYKETSSKVWGGRPLIFTCSLTDFFHEGIDGYRHEAWDIIRKCPHLIFQILTKRPERVVQCLPEDWGEGWDNVWFGTSVGSMNGYDRAIELYKVPAKTRFLSIEPLWAPVSLPVVINKPTNSGPSGSQPLDIKGLATDWVIVGGESGNETGKYRYRPCELSWIEDIVDTCKKYNTPVFVKQMGTHLAKQMKMKGHGGNMEQFPEHLRVREFPNVKNIL